MNRADFSTQPNGFPLESDATLGFMQNDYQSAIKGLAKALAGNGNVIVTGLNVVNGVATDGWIYYEGDLIYFQGGTVSTHFIITEEKTAKANQNGELVDRYFVKKARFGTGANQVVFTSLTRIYDLPVLQSVLNMLANAQGFVTEIIVLSGLKYTTNNIGSGTALFSNQILSVAPFQGVVNEQNPIYLTSTGQWTRERPETNFLEFSPYHNQQLDTVLRRNLHSEGEIKWIDTDELDLQFFNNGLGKWEWHGWRIANGQGGTVNLTDAIDGLTALQRI